MTDMQLQPIEYEVTLVSPRQAGQLRRRRRIRRSTVAAALAVAVLAPSPLTAMGAHPIHSACCFVLSC